MKQLTVINKQGNEIRIYHDTNSAVIFRPHGRYMVVSSDVNALDFAINTIMNDHIDSTVPRTVTYISYINSLEVTQPIIKVA